MPSPSYPSGHAPHTEFPSASSEQVTSLSHPPLRTSHALDLTQLVSPVPLYPAGHALHVRPPGVFVQSVSRSQSPLRFSHSSMSVHVTPSPS